MAAIRSGVAAVAIVSRMASSMPMSELRRLGGGPDEPDPVEDQRVAGEHEEEQHALEGADRLVGDADRGLGGLATEIGERQHQPCHDDAERIETPEEGD